MDSYGYNLNYAREASYPSALANSSLLLPLLFSLMSDRRTPRTRDSFQSQYDYIIVGGGTAGSALASRLSEEDCVNILLLEAGEHPPILSDVAIVSRSFWNSDIDWGYQTVPQKHTAFGLKGNKLNFPMGKVLGGTSIFNGNLYVRGNHQNYDNWVKLGAKGWGYEDVLPYFKRAENNNDFGYVASGYHGQEGPVSVSRTNYKPQLRDSYFQAAREYGYRIGDANGARQTGFYEQQATLRESVRCSAAKSYLVPAENRTNLDILLKAFVRKIEIGGNPLTATGVTFDHGGQTYSVKARREVILSAGTVHSAKLLMLSGVGPKAELAKHNIPLLVDLPVGKNLMDHPASFINFLLDRNLIQYPKSSDPKYVQEFIDHRSGPLAQVVSVGLAFLKGDEVNPTEDFPNYEMYFREVMTNGLKDPSYNFKDELYNAYFKQDENKPMFGCSIQLLQPKSRGEVTLHSADPYGAPVIDPNYFDHPQDLEDIVQGLKQCIKFSKTEGFQRLGAKLPEQLFPGCEDYCEDEDRYLGCIAQQVVATTSHETGTARMGDPRDPAAVVDPQLRVKNVCNLRVVDASVMPLVPSANTMAAVYMIAEKAADMIKEDLKKSLEPEVYTIIVNN